MKTFFNPYKRATSVCDCNRPERMTDVPQRSGPPSEPVKWISQDKKRAADVFERSGQHARTTHTHRKCTQYPTQVNQAKKRPSFLQILTLVQFIKIHYNFKLPKIND